MSGVGEVAGAKVASSHTDTQQHVAVLGTGKQMPTLRREPEVMMTPDHGRIEERFDERLDEGEVPPWSGVPDQVSEDLLLVPLHVSDTRSIHLHGWQHVSYIESLGGDVEYHVYRRA